MNREEIFAHIEGERENQIAGGGLVREQPAYKHNEWVESVLGVYVARFGRAKDDYGRELALIKIAAIAVAAIEERSGK